MQAVDKAQTDHRLAVANGSTDPTFSAGCWPQPADRSVRRLQRQHSAADLRPQPGREAAHALDITRNERLRDAAEAQVFSDVDSAYATFASTVELLQPYKANISTVRAGAGHDLLLLPARRRPLLDFLNAESDYRTVQLNYVNLVGSYLSAAAQFNMAVGREVIQ